MASISEISVQGLSYPAGPLHAERWGTDQHAYALTVTDTDGAQGRAVGRCHLGTTAADVRDLVPAVLVGACVGWSEASHGERWEALNDLVGAQYLPVFPVSVWDVALWDLRGVRAGLPIAALLTEEPAVAVEAYASIPTHHQPHELAEDAADRLAEGFTAIKLHPTTRGLDHDLDLARHLRQAVGDQVELMFDARRTLCDGQALTLARELYGLGFEWLEEPFGPYEWERHRRLRRAVPIPLAGFETAPGGPAAALEAAASGAFDRIEVDCFWKGGITGAARTVDLVRAEGLGIVMHHGASPSMNLANLHLAAGLQIDRIELLTPAADYGPGTTLPPIRVGRGIEVPRAPGLGECIDEDWFQTHTTFVDRWKVSA